MIYHNKCDFCHIKSINEVQSAIKLVDSLIKQAVVFSDTHWDTKGYNQNKQEFILPKFTSFTKMCEYSINSNQPNQNCRCNKVYSTPGSPVCKIANEYVQFRWHFHVIVS